MSVTSNLSSSHLVPAEADSRRETAAERSRAATRTRLIESGLVLFAERGIHGLTTHDIAADAGVAAGTFYNHFKDKAALLQEIADIGVTELNRRLDAVGDAERPLRESVRPVAEALASFAEDQRDLIRILFSRDSEAAAVEADVLDALAASISDGRREAIARGEMPEEIHPDLVSQAIVGMWSRVLAWWTENPSLASREEVVETLTRIQLAGTHPG